MVSFGNFVLKAKEYFKKMLNSFGEVQELRERLSKAIQLNNVIKVTPEKERIKMSKTSHIIQNIEARKISSPTPSSL